MKRNTYTIEWVRSFATRCSVLGVLGLIIMIGVTGCFPKPPEDDEGHATFAREAIPVLLGRRPTGVDEVEVVADIAELLGRDVAVDMLMKDTNYVDHWTDTIVDLLEVQRQDQGGIGVAADAACWGEPTRANPDPSIAEWVRDHDPRDAGAPTPAWNMTDLVRSAVVLDDLSPVFRANLMTTSLRRAGSNGREAEMANYVMRVYLNRNTDCLGCHNPEASTSNKTDASGTMLWRRLWNVPGHPEKALLGNYLSGATAFDRVRQVMRGDVRQPAANGFGNRPWGMNNSCLTDTTQDNPQNNGTVTHLGFRTIPSGAQNRPNAGFGSLDGASNGKLSVWELEDAFHAGVNDLRDGYERTQPATANHPAGSDEALYCGFVDAVQSKCTTCHRVGGAASFLNMAGDDPAQVLFDQGLVVPNNLAGSTLWNRVNGGGMPPVSQPQLTPSQKTAIQNWISGGAPNPGDVAICTASKIPDVEPDEAFAYLTASNFVDGVWESVMGYPLTIEHGFPRNKDQMHLLWNLTESVFVKNDWSLKSTLRKMLTSTWFARRAPNLSQEGTAYELPPYNPWFAADPSITPNPPADQKHNGQGEVVNMYRVNTLLRNVSGALGWKQPKRFPPSNVNTVDYPYPLDTELGQYLSPALPGFKGVNFQSLLALESRLGSAGSCDKNGRSDAADDWIDALVAAIDTHNAANPTTPITIGDAFAMVKDRLIQDPTIETTLPSSLASVADAKTEQQAVTAFFQADVANPLTIHSATSELTTAELQTKLRQACGTVIKSPEFILPHITPRGYSDNNMPDPPVLTVCLPGEACGYPKACGMWRSKLSGMGHQTICEDRTIRTGVRYLIPFPGKFTGPVLEIDPNRWKTKKPLFESILRPVEDRPTFMFDATQVKRDQEARVTDAVPNRASLSLLSRDISIDPGTTAMIIKAASAPSIKKSDSTKVRPLQRQEVMQSSQPLDLKGLRVKKGRDNVKGYEPSQPAYPGVELNLVRDLTVVDANTGKQLSQSGLDRIRQRLSSLCLNGLCGFQANAGIQQCVSKRDEGASCDRLRSVCDPRCQDGDNCCGNPPTDASKSGVLTIWAEGSVVREADGVRILPLGQRRWRTLKPGTRLQSGDLIDLPMSAKLAIQTGNVLFGDQAIRTEQKLRSRHMLSITGPSASKIVDARVKKNVLHPNTIAAGVQTGAFLSKGISRKQWQRILEQQPKPEHNQQLSEKEIAERLADYAAQHEGMEEPEK